MLCVLLLLLLVMVERVPGETSRVWTSARGALWLWRSVHVAFAFGVLFRIVDGRRRRTVQRSSADEIICESTHSSHEERRESETRIIMCLLSQPWRLSRKIKMMSLGNPNEVPWSRMVHVDDIIVSIHPRSFFRGTKKQCCAIHPLDIVCSSSAIASYKPSTGTTTHSKNSTPWAW